MAADLLRVGDMTAAPGEKVRGYLAVPGTEPAIPLTLIHGARAGKAVVILSGIHGGEYVGIETAIRFAATLEPGELRGRVLVAHPVNLAAFFDRRQYVHPADGKNLNRVFPGRADGTAAERIAFAVTEQLFRQADFVIDLHGGDIHEALMPFVVCSGGESPQVAALAEDAARRTGLPYLTRVDHPGASFGAAGVLGIPAILMELGQCGRWSADEVDAYTAALRNVLRHLEMLPGTAEPPRAPVYLSGLNTVVAAESGCWHPCVAVGDRVAAGDAIGEMRDVFGRALRRYAATQAGVILVLVTSLAVGAGESLFAVGPFQEAEGKG